MSDQWYYVHNNERVGPVDVAEIENLIQSAVIKEDSFVWKKGFDNWAKLADVEELMLLKKVEHISIEEVEDIPLISDTPPILKQIDWDSIGENEKLFLIKIGYDRGDDEKEYGPFSIAQLRRAYTENRVNEKTYIFLNGIENWMLLGESPVFNKISSLPPNLDDIDRRQTPRKPFVARLFFHDNSDVFEGICRDVSIGGLQVLVSEAPCKVGDIVNLNVHPENSDYCFVASGKVVRLLDGKQGFSLRFEGLPEESKKAITTYVSK